jgi:ABC-type glutathione transport system ATPase component
VLIDEVLAVGDAAFQQKCFSEFVRLKAEGRTIVFVTHDMGSVERFCDRAMLLERGRVVDTGNPQSITRQYNELNFRRVRAEAREHSGPETLRRSPVAELLGAWFESADGERLVETPQGQTCWVRMDVLFHDRARDPLFAIALHDDNGRTAFATSTQLRHGATGEFHPGEQVSVRVRFDNWLAPGRYRLTASVSRDGFGADAYDLRDDISSIIVHSGKSGGGAVDLPSTFEIERR